MGSGWLVREHVNSVVFARSTFLPCCGTDADPEQSAGSISSRLVNTLDLRIVSTIIVCQAAAAKASQGVTNSGGVQSKTTLTSMKMSVVLFKEETCHSQKVTAGFSQVQRLGCWAQTNDRIILIDQICPSIPAIYRKRINITIVNLNYHFVRDNRHRKNARIRPIYKIALAYGFYGW